MAFVRPLTATVKTPVAAVPVTFVTPVPLSCGLALVVVGAYTTPTSVKVPPPLLVTLPPSDAPLTVMLAEVGEEMVGADTVTLLRMNGRR